MIHKASPQRLHAQRHATSAAQLQQQQQQYLPGEKRLLVKVVRATELGGQHPSVEPYCVVELDEPPQKHQTSIKKDTVNPIWDEAFLL